MTAVGHLRTAREVEVSPLLDGADKQFCLKTYLTTSELSLL